jgi:hypothetical protein
VHHVAPDDAEAIVVEPANPHGVPFPKRMFRRSGYRFADKNMRQQINSRACPDSEGTGQALARAFLIDELN